MYKLVDAIIAKQVQMAAVATADTDLRKGNGSPLVLARECDARMSRVHNCSALTTLFYQAETEPMLHECKGYISNAFWWSYEQTVTNLSMPWENMRWTLSCVCGSTRPYGNESNSFSACPSNPAGNAPVIFFGQSFVFRREFVSLMSRSSPKI